MNAWAFVMIVILMGGVLLGLALGNTDLLNPMTRAAEAARLQAEATRLQQLNQAEQQRTQLDLAVQQRRADIDLRAYQEQRARETVRLEEEAHQRHQLLGFAFVFVTGTFSGCLIMVSGAVSHYILRRARYLDSAQPPPTRTSSRPRILDGRNRRRHAQDGTEDENYRDAA